MSNPTDSATAPSAGLPFETTAVSAELAEGHVARCRVLVERLGEVERGAVVSDLERAADAAGCRMVLDMSAVLLLLSAGIGALLTVHKKCVAGGGCLVIYGLQPEIQQMLHLTGLPKVLSIEKDEKRAMKAVR